MQRLWQQAADIWGGMSRARRGALVTVAVLVLAGVAGVVWYSSQVEYRILFSGLTAEEAGAVTGKLQAQNVPFKLAAGGTAVLVPADQVAPLRVGLANDGLPAHGGKGFEIFDESSLGTTPFVQNVNYTRALQSELARSIGQMESVVSARVHIVRPEQSPFVREQKQTTASVLLKLKPGATLNRSTAQAITSLVSHAVEGLTPEQVTIVDANSGRLLSDLRSSDGDGVPGTQLEYRRELEQYLSTQAEELLGKSIGYGRAIVKVAADVNFKRVKEKKETYSPDDRVVVSERVTNSNASPGGSGGARGGVAGASSNTGRAGPSSAAAGGSSKDESVQTDYLVSKTVQEYEDKLGRVERLTVAVMVDLSGVSGITADDVRDTIKQAVGFKAGRDEIKVSNVKLVSLQPSEDEPNEEAQRVLRWQEYLVVVRNISIGVAVVLALVLGFLVVRRLRSAPAERPAPAPPSAPAAGVEGGAAAALDEVTAAARQDPAMVASLVVGMMGQ